MAAFHERAKSTETLTNPDLPARHRDTIRRRRHHLHQFHPVEGTHREFLAGFLEARGFLRETVSVSPGDAVGRAGGSASAADR